jgi:hypothetical protein
MSTVTEGGGDGVTTTLGGTVGDVSTLESVSWVDRVGAAVVSGTINSLVRGTLVDARRVEVGCGSSARPLSVDVAAPTWTGDSAGDINHTMPTTAATPTIPAAATRPRPRLIGWVACRRIGPSSEG